MKNLFQWLSTERRQELQAFAATLGTLCVLLNLAPDSVVEQWLFIVGVIMQFISNLSALLNVRKGDWGAGWAIIRGAVYAAGTAVAPALVILGYISEDASQYFLTIFGVVLSLVGNLVAILTSSRQQRGELVDILTELETSKSTGFRG